MGMHLAHNVRILKIKLNFFFFASWLSSVDFFFQCLLQQGGVAPSWTCHALFPQAPNSWDGSVRILKKARGNIFLKWYYLEEIVKIISFWKKFSSVFQYSASTETNDTSAESLGSQLTGARQKRTWHGQEGATPTCCKRHWKKK